MDIPGTSGGGFSSGKKNNSDRSSDNTGYRTSGDTGIDSTGVIGGITGAIGTLGDIIIGGLNLEQQEKNYEQQKKQFKYSKKLQREIFEREDNAVLRRTLDMKRAGLNPILAAGNAASSGPVVSTVAPQKEMMKGFDLSKAMLALAMMKQKQDISKTIAEEELIRLQHGKTMAEKKFTETKNKQADFDYQASVRSGIPSNASTPGRMIKDARGYVGLTWQQIKNTAKGIKDKLINNVNDRNFNTNDEWKKEFKKAGLIK